MDADATEAVESLRQSYLNAAFSAPDETAMLIQLWQFHDLEERVDECDESNVQERREIEAELKRRGVAFCDGCGKPGDDHWLLCPTLDENKTDNISEMDPPDFGGFPI
ncbi:hypothetical protein ABGB17_12615 [Sphaerisporangium sp. B11E5]|uniref:hypothetical protein n=1 Tax=Sphaerisporangium sp. B11E5 TaxID=3153563 RepID=UPI00325C7513